MFDAASAAQIPSPNRLLRRTIDNLMARLVLNGRLAIRYPDATETLIGVGAAPILKVEFQDWSTLRRILLNPGLAFGEAYVDGALVPVGCTVYELLDLLLPAVLRGGLGPFGGVHKALDRLGKRIDQLNPAIRARHNVRHHYDLSAELYALLLDADMQYSCAYFRHGSETLDEAQAAKKRHIASKLLLHRPGLRVLDIGCGWGGMALTLARDYGADVTGITLSTEQLDIARARAEQAGLADRVRFELLDYRAIPRTYDRIVSVGMFEHVGVNHYRRFFEVVRRSLEPDGVALVHAIGRSAGPSTTNAWLRRYIFPGGYSPALSEVLPAVEKAGLIATDLEILRLHYAETLRHWRANLAANHDAILALYDERFVRMFEFYLSAAELAFRHTGHMIWQLQLARQASAVPLTRDYIAAGDGVLNSVSQAA